MFLVSVCGGALVPAQLANAHYVQPPGEWEAAPAVVAVHVVLRFRVQIHDMGKDAFQGYDVDVAQPVATGAVINASGTVLTSASVAGPDSTAARIYAANRAFRAHEHTRWSDAQLHRRQRLPDREADAMLQQCYRPRGGSRCSVVQRASLRSVTFDTTRPMRMTVSRYPVSTVALLNAVPAPAQTPTVGLSGTVSPDAEYMAIGYDGSGRRMVQKVKLQGTQLSSADQRRLVRAFSSGADGVILVDGASKGDVAAVLTRGGNGVLAVVAPRRDVTASAVQVDRSQLQDSVDEALGYFNGHHYAHALPLLTQVTKELPDRELMEFLATAKAKKGTAEDVSEAMTSSPATKAAGPVSWPWLVAVPLALGLSALTAGMLSRRRRAGRSTEEPEELGDGDDSDLFEQPDEGELSGGLAAAAATPPQVARAVEAAPIASAEGMAGHYCTRCGTGLLVGDRFCYHCGTPAR